MFELRNIPNYMRKQFGMIDDNLYEFYLFQSIKEMKFTIFQNHFVLHKDRFITSKLFI